MYIQQLKTNHMKKLMIGVAIFCFLCTCLNAQEINLIKNNRTGTFLNIQNNKLQSSGITGDLRSAQWQLIDAGNGNIRIRNLEDNTYLNIEYGSLRSSAIENGWLSALWMMKPIEGSHLIRINNVWKPTLYLVLNEELECATIDDNPQSANWELQPVAGTTAPAEHSQTIKDNNGQAGLFNIQRILDAHNSLRQEVGVQPLVWSDELAQKAQKWANYLAEKNKGEAWVLEHSGPGENIAGGYASGDTPEKRVYNGWGDEKADFNPATKQCLDGKICGHYTQIVWRNTTKVGCAITVNDNGKYILVCNYDPPGNYNGQPAF